MKPTTEPELTPEQEKEAIDKINEQFKPNRAQRRQKPQKARANHYGYIIVPENILTSPSHKYKMIRKKNAPTKQQRKRTIAKARKAAKADYSQVS